jgi:hypothetical protein
MWVSHEDILYCDTFWGYEISIFLFYFYMIHKDNDNIHILSIILYELERIVPIKYHKAHDF